jgi:hypothetical protein
MEGDQGDHQLVEAFPTRKRGAVDRMKTRRPHRQRIADVVQPGCRHQAIPTGYVELSPKPAGSRCDPQTCVSRSGRTIRRDSAAARARVTCGEFIMSTLTILALIEMFDESVRPSDEISDDVLAGRRTSIRL